MQHARTFSLGILVSFIFMAALPGCSNRGHYTFAKQPQPLQLPTSLHTDGVYVQEAFSWDTMFCIYRFYQDGKCYWSNWQKGNYRLEKLHRTDFEKGQPCYFRNEHDTVTVELYSDKYSGYTFERGQLEDGFLCIYGIRPKGLTGKEIALPQPECFRFVPFTR